MMRHKRMEMQHYFLKIQCVLIYLKNGLSTCGTEQFLDFSVLWCPSCDGEGLTRGVGWHGIPSQRNVVIWYQKNVNFIIPDNSFVTFFSTLANTICNNVRIIITHTSEWVFNLEKKHTRARCKLNRLS